MQIQKKFSSFLKEFCKEMSDLLNRHFMQEKCTGQKSLTRICQDSCISSISCRILEIFARIMHYVAKSYKKLPRMILQVSSDRLTRVAFPCLIPKTQYCAIFPTNWSSSGGLVAEASVIFRKSQLSNLLTISSNFLCQCVFCHLTITHEP